LIFKKNIVFRHNLRFSDKNIVEKYKKSGKIY